MPHLAVDTRGWVRTQAGDVTVDVRMAYDVGDPLAVHVTMREGVAEWTWVFGRDLLVDGLRSAQPVGEGDVRVHSDDVLGHVVVGRGPLALTLLLPVAVAKEFLWSTYREVPRDEELVDVDAWLASLS